MHAEYDDGGEQTHVIKKINTAPKQGDTSQRHESVSRKMCYSW